jgi:mono/diheme cytochrome c family protein
MAAVLKTARRKPRGFESLPLRPTSATAHGRIFPTGDLLLRVIPFLRAPHPRLLPVAMLALVVLALSLAGCDQGAAATPIPPTAPPVPTALVRGAMQFASYCQLCHPGGQRGVGPQLIGIRDSDSQIKAVIRSGKSNMPPFDAAHIPDDDLQSLVDYIRSLK